MAANAGGIVAYFRVSTKKQGESGLGLEGQEFAVNQFAERTGNRILAKYTEIESGRISDRPELIKAKAHAKRSKAILVVAKLDRLSRNVAFLSALMESDFEFVACDNPHANRLTIHILAAVAEDEARRISERTKAALQAAKARGMLLGSSRPGHWVGKEERRAAGGIAGSKIAAESNRAAALSAYCDLLPVIQQFREVGLSLRTIAVKLDELGHSTRRGKRWNANLVRAVLLRAEAGDISAIAVR